MENRDDHSSVTFVQLACTGATSDDLLTKRHNGEPPQIPRMVSLLGGRIPDAVILGVGGDDIGFSHIIIGCFLHHACNKPGGAIDTMIRRGLSKLITNMGSIHQELNSAGIPDDHVYIPEYPNITENQNGDRCSVKVSRSLIFFLAPWSGGLRLGADPQRFRDQPGRDGVGRRPGAARGAEPDAQRPGGPVLRRA